MYRMSYHKNAIQKEEIDIKNAMCEKVKEFQHILTNQYAHFGEGIFEGMADFPNNFMGS